MGYRRQGADHSAARLGRTRRGGDLVCSSRLLSAADEVELAQIMEQGDDRAIEAKRRFVQANLGLAISMATKTAAPTHVARDDMIQDAMIGLERAVQRFDWRLGNRFSTYASWWIRQAIQEGLENTVGPVRIPAHRSRELYRALEGAHGDSAQLPSGLRSTFEMATMGSLDQPRRSGEDSYARAGSELVGATPTDNVDPADEVLAAGDRSTVAALVATLNPASRYAVIRRFGLDGRGPATFADIASELGVSPEAARRRVKRSLSALRPAAIRLASAESEGTRYNQRGHEHRQHEQPRAAA